MKECKNLFLGFLCILGCWGCSQSSNTEKFQNKRDCVMNIRDRVKEIAMEEVLIGRNAGIYLMDDYLLVNDYTSYDKHIHLFNKKNFKYLASTAYRGEGPDEITIIGSIGIDEPKRMFYVSDHGKRKVFSFNLDSVLADPFYTPKVKMNLKEREFPVDYLYVNDTLSYAVIVNPIGNSDFNQCLGKWNMVTGEIHPMKYEHPEIEKRRIGLAVSVERGLYAECYRNHDLLTVGTLSGNLKYNIYGPKWSNEKTNEYRYYDEVAFCGDKLLATTAFGKVRLEKNSRPTAFLVFDLNGNYLQTLETGYQILYFSYDQDNNRLILILDDEIQFAYLPLDGII